MSATPLVRLLLTGIGLLAAAALVWFVGPLVSVGARVPLAGENARWIAIAALALAALAHAAWRSLHAARSNRGLLKGMLADESGAPAVREPQADDELPPQPAPGQQEVEVLGERFARAVGMLKRRKVAGRKPWLSALSGRPYVYQLPWYVIIGAPGAGKTTALANSGLEFPLASRLGKKVIRGVGGTRNCDWWFASDAVLLDTAGRYTTQDSHQAADRAAWLGFLKLLVRYRPGQPINGVLLTVSVSDLLNADARQRAEHARALRQRIDELHEHLGVRLPIYVLVTKTDLLAGFMEFFADFGRDDREQVWGVTFPYDTDLTSDDPLVRLASDFADLEIRLNQCLIERLQTEQDRERRAVIYAFPQQWGVLRETLHDFLQQTFAQAGDAQRPFLRGVYFTSATQEGTPIDRAMGALARALGLEGRVVQPARPSGKTFFVTRMLKDVVLGEAGLAGTNLRWQHRRSVLRWGLMSACALVLAVMAGLGWHAWRTDRDHVASTSERVGELQRGVAAARASAPTDLAALLPTLRTLQTLQGEASRSQAPSRWPTLGLDHGAMLAAAAQDAYQRELKDAFLPRIAARLEERLRTGGREHVERLYEDLKAYLMLFGGRNFDRAALRAFLSADWDATLPQSVSASQRDELRRNLDALLASGEVGAPTQVDPKVVAHARETVASVPLAVRAYARLRQSGESIAPPFTVESAGGAKARGVFARASGQSLDSGVPGLYTRAVYQQSLRARTQEVVRQLAREQSWVMGSTPPDDGAPTRGLEPLVDEVERLYRADYIRLWDEFIGDLRLLPPASMAAATETAQVLSGADSPLAALMRGIVRELGVGPAQGSGAPASAAREPLIDPRFEPLQRYVVGSGAPLDEAIALLGRLAVHLGAVDDALKRRVAVPASDVLRALDTGAQGAPQPWQDMLATLARRSAGLVFAAAREPIARQMASEFTPGCTSAVAGRYPFVPGAREEISREAFAKLFATGGQIDVFFQRQLAPYADLSTRPWAWWRADGTREDSSESLQQFQRAQTIRETYFREGGRTLGSPLEFRPIELDPGIAQFVLEVDGQTLRFARDQKAAQSLNWPGPGAGRVRLQVVPASGGGEAGPGYVFEGPWALFRLLERVRIEPGSTPQRTLLAFDVEGRRARFELRSSTGAVHPLVRQELERFQCPKQP